MPNERYIPTDAEAQRAEALLKAQPGLWPACERIAKVAVSRIIRKGVPFQVEHEELLRGWAVPGAWLAICRFEPARGLNPITLVHHYVYGEIKHGLRALARERGCPGWRWENGDYEERELPLDETMLQGKRPELRDRAADVALRQVEQDVSGEYEEFAKTLPPHYRAIADALRGDPDISGAELARQLKISPNYESHSRQRLRERWTQFWRHREACLQHAQDVREARCA